MADDKLEIINPPNTLKGKVGTGGPGAVDVAALERAEKVISDMSDSYLEWVEEDLKKIDQAYQILKAADGDRVAELENVFQVSHDIKGQGGSFGYDMMTVIGNELCRLIEKTEKVTDAEVEAVKLHIDSMKLVIAGRIKGNGGKQGEQMMSGLHMICEKLLG